jgi:hypothetical protein
MPLTRLLRDAQFQSTPPVAGERCKRAKNTLSALVILTGFNPRPPLPGSDAPRLDSSSVTAVMQVFQSTPPVAGERCPRLKGVSELAHPDRHGFNPRPPLPGSDARGSPAWYVIESCSKEFQSTPPVAGERCSSSVTVGSKSTKSPHCANVLAQERSRSYMRWQCTKKLN